MSTFSRRDFIAALSGAFLVAPFVSTSQTLSPKLRNTLNIKFFCPRWGAKDPWEDFCRRVKEAGYDGVETPLPNNQTEIQEFLRAMKKHELELILMALPGPSDFNKHKGVYEEILHECAGLKPLLINSHTGKDFFTFEQNEELIKRASEISFESGVKILHESHRGRFSFAAHITKIFLEKIPGLRLTLDISHWCNVAESLLENQREAVELALDRTEHIHARVGYQQGPQVNDPRAPEWEKVVNAHLAWWDKVVEKHRKKGSPSLTITSEFGPPPNYMQTQPYSREPLADQWDVNVYMMKLLKERYS